MKRYFYTLTLMLFSVGLFAQGTVVDVIVNSPDHETLETAVIAAELDDDLSSPGPFTVFAPTDAAFDALPAGVLDALLADPTGDLADILLYHVASGNVLSGDLSDGQMITTLFGEDVTVSIDGDGNVMINNAMVTLADVTADNGVVHVIDAVLLPPTTTVVDIIVNSPDHETLEAAVIAAELDDDLSGEGPFTVFAPTDAAFDALPAGVLDALLADPTGDLADILLYHVASGNVLSGDLSDGQMITTLFGEDVTVSIDGDGNVMINNAMVTVADVTADNGVVHVIDAVLLPPTTTVVDIIVNSPDHETLEAAVIAAELDDDLSGEGPFTVFAPTDAAFDALPAGVLDALLADPTGDLADILLYHVASGNVLSGDLSDGQMITTLFGEDVTVSIDGDGNVMINNAMVTLADVTADNGVVHVIDAVLLPPTTTVVDIIVNSPDHETLEAAVIAAELDDDLSGEGPFTVFAPTDAAFDALPAGVLDALLADPTGDLADILLYHVASGNVLSGDLSDGQMITTLFGEDVTVSIDGDGNVMINNAMVTVADVTADNGVVHVIDAVLLPPTTTVVDIIVNSPDHETLEAAVIAAELDDDLSGEGPFTVFAPTDAAFDALPAGVLDALLADPTGDLADILLYHVASGNVLSGDLSDGQMITTLFGEDVTVSIDGDGNVMINNAMVTVADVTADNGVVHVIDAVLLPPTTTVVDIIVNSPDHETLEAAVIAAELDDDLSGEGPFTVFAPTDAAFDALPAGVLDALLADPTGDLADILLYHVASGNVLSGDLSDGQMITTLFGEDVTVSIDGDGNVMINDAMVTVADITADNGVVHVIDAVLLPEVETTTVVDIIVNSPDHETLEAAVIAAELDDDLSGEGPFTVFAPTDAAFDALPAGVLDDLLDDPTGALADILLYHVASGNVLSGDLSDGQMITTLFGEDVTVSIDGDGNVMINDAMVIVADLEADNGVVHVIDAVLLPEVETTTVVDIIVNSPDHETLEAAVIAAELDDDLSGEGPFTVFAPTDAAFDALPAGILDELLDDPTGDLADILLYHVASGNVLSTDLMDDMDITTLQGDDVTVTIDGADVMINDAMVTVVDIQADNGVVHVIDAVLLPPVNVEESAFDGISLYPNPATDIVTLRGEVPAGVEYTIVDATGRVVLTSTFNGVATLDVTNFSTGLYSIIFTGTQGVGVKQLMVK